MIAPPQKEAHIQRYTLCSKSCLKHQLVNRSYENYPIGDLQSKVAQRNIMMAVKKVTGIAAKEKRPPEELCVLVDKGASNLGIGIGVAPCLTKARGQSHNLFKLQTGQAMSLTELLRLQGFDNDEIASMNMVISPKQLGGLLGNGFTKTVLQRLLVCCIRAAEMPA